ncbi:MAG: 5-methylthioadenosine/S-adenosylhomocysteine deaminase [Candidatus Nanohaloarchaea archaeon]|jgi:5-methylthioadenosine/S-adenosylhomocysteine deaminase
MILKNIRYLIKQDSDRRVLEKVDLKVVDDKIAAVGEELDARGHDVIDCSDKAVIPGLVNAHTHISMTLLRGLSDNKQLQNWLEEDIFPAEDKIEPRDAYLGAMLGISEMLKTGTTTFNDMYFHMDKVAEAVEDSGIRAVLSRGIIDEDGDREDIDEALNFVEKYQDHELVTPGFAPHAVYTASESALLEARDYSEVFDVPYHIHVSETRKEVKDCIEETGETPVQYLDSLGLVNQDLIAAHGVWLGEEDLDILSEKGGSVVHNPSANLKLGSGIAEVPVMLERGINVALGTDGVASNNNLNLFEEGKLTALLHKRDDPREIHEQEVLDMMTINGAKALGRGDEIGSIEIGKKADLVIIDLDRPEMNPVHGKEGLVSNLIYSFSGDVSDVIIDGRIVVREGELRMFDDQKIIDEVDVRKNKFS